MPTILREDGFDVFFYANEHLPRHVHVKKGDDIARIELETMTITRSTFKAGDIRRMIQIVRAHRDRLMEAWDEYFARD